MHLIIFFQFANPNGKIINGPAADIWSLGYTVLKMLTHQVLYNNMERKSIILKTTSLIEDAIKYLFSKGKLEKLLIADLGCSSGPNTFSAVALIMNAVHVHIVQDNTWPETHVFFNDLYVNDFNSVIKAIPSFYEELKEMVGLDDRIESNILVSVVPGSFYRRLFGSKSMHFVYSATSLHWLSQVPSLLQGDNNKINKGNVALGKTSTSIVHAAYLDQFEKDFSNFLRLRSKEMVSGGCMVLTLLGRPMRDPFTEECQLDWNDLAFALGELVSQGVVDEEKFNAFNMPFYAPYIDELAKVIESEGSFEIVQLMDCEREGAESRGRQKNEEECIAAANVCRAILEPMLATAFGEEIMDHLFEKVAAQIAKCNSSESVFLMISLSKRN